MENFIIDNALRFALMFTEQNKIPIRYKNVSFLKKIFKSNSKIEEEFEKIKRSWEETLYFIYQSLDKELANRIFKTKPDIEEGTLDACYNNDFIQFNEYLEKIRDYKDPEEVGQVSMLLKHFQDHINKNIDKTNYTPKPESHKPTYTPLKNEKAELIRREGSIEINGIEVKLWRKHTIDTVDNNMSWNKIESYTELNSRTAGELGSICFTGVFQIPRKEAADYAVKLGFKVHAKPSRNVNYVIVGSENVSPSKIAKMIELNEKGANIQLIDENTFLEIVAENLDL